MGKVGNRGGTASKVAAANLNTTLIPDAATAPLLSLSHCLVFIGTGAGKVALLLSTIVWIACNRQRWKQSPVYQRFYNLFDPFSLIEQFVII